MSRVQRTCSFACLLLLHAQVCVSFDAKTFQLTGEPKSGTTWLEIIMFEIAKQLCRDAARNHCRVLGTFDQRVQRSFSLDVFGNKQLQVNFVSGGKHSLPFLPSTKGALCNHAGGFARRHPCGMSDSDGVDAVRRCVRQCSHQGKLVTEGLAKSTTSSTKGNTKGTIYLAIFRDPRDVTISMCFHRHGNTTSTNKLDKCLKDNYVKQAQWIRFRHLYYDYFPRMSVVLLCYHQMREHSEEQMRYILEAMQINRGVSVNQIRDVYSATSPDALRHNKGYNMHNPSSSKPKVRSAGSKHYTDYGLNQSTISWMRDVFERLEFPYLIGGQMCMNHSLI